MNILNTSGFLFQFMLLRFYLLLKNERNSILIAYQWDTQGIGLLLSRILILSSDREKA